MLYKVYNPNDRESTIILDNGKDAVSHTITDTVMYSKIVDWPTMIRNLTYKMWRRKLDRETRHIPDNEVVISYLMEIHRDNIETDAVNYIRDIQSDIVRDVRILDR